MKIAILQPSYLPWIGYFDQMVRVDQFVLFDDVQFTRRDWRNRNKIRTKDGWAWVTVPVQQKDKFGQLLRETRIDNNVNWRRKHLEAIRHNYAQSPYFDLYFPYFESIYNKEWNFLVDLCIETILHFKDVLNIPTPVIKSSEMNISEKKWEKILAICKQLNATRYLTGDLAKNYLSAQEFLKNDIALEYHEYEHPEYTQRYPEFVPYLSIVDLLFNHGDKSLQIITGKASTGP